MVPIVLGLSLFVTLCDAQEFRGTILGRVSDPSGAAIAGAQVKVINLLTNVTSSAVTEADGAYSVRFLIPATYRIEVEVPGFRKLIQSGISVDVGQKATVDVVLELGQTRQTVEVTANAPLLETTTGGMGQVLNQQHLDAMPLNGRGIFVLTQLAEGVTWQVPTFGATGTSGLRPFDNQGESAWSINGGRVATNEYVLDGGPNSTRGRFNYSPPVDSVAEYKVQTNTYDAQYGRTGGGVINMTLKSGTNRFHGTLWDYVRYGSWDANNTLNNARGEPRPPHQYNQYGAMVNGPIYKDKTFFMLTWEGLRERVPFPIRVSVPTLAERNGDFCQSYSDQPTPLVIYDPLTTRPNNQRDKLIDCSDPNKRVIPASRINPIAQKIFAIYPLPNVPNQRLNNYVNPTNKGIYNYNSEVIRIDHVFSDKLKFFGDYYQNHRDEFRSNNGLQGTFANQGQWPQTRNNHGAIADFVYALNQKSLVNLRLTFTRFLESNFQTDVAKYDRKQLGFTNLPGEFMPRIDLEQFTDIGVGSQGRGTIDNTGSIQANYTRAFSKHTMNVGLDYRNIRSNPVTSGDSSGHFAFTRTFTRQNALIGDAQSGNSVASLLLGYPASGFVGAGSARALQWNYYGLFVHDDFRVTRNLTLNLGFRWDYESPVTERYNRLVRGFAFDQANPLSDQVKNAPGVSECPACANLNGGLLFAGVGGAPRALFEPDHHDFQPRLGFAYRWRDKTVFRGGYGRYYMATTQFGNQTGFFNNTSYIANDLGGRVGVPETSVNKFSNPFPNGLVASPGASLGLMTQVGQGISFDDPNRTVPYIYMYNFGVQRQITPNLTIDLTYVGSQVRRLPVGRGINEISAADLAKGAANSQYLTNTVTNPFLGLVPGTGINGRTVQRQQLLRPYPEFIGIGENSMAIGKSWYNSFQMRVEKRLSYGLKFISSYTFSKEMEQNNFLNAQDTVMVRQLVDFDRTHHWVFSGLYDLPFGRGRKFLSQARGIRNGLIGGWRINWIYTMESGIPLSEPGGLERLAASAKLANPTPDRWFNTCYLKADGSSLQNGTPAEVATWGAVCANGELSPVWKVRPPFTLRTTPDRLSDVRAPWRPTLDMSVFKDINFTELVKLQYRFETFNTLNTVILPPPDTNFASKNFGSIPSPRGSIYFPRNVQMALKLYF